MSRNKPATPGRYPSGETDDFINRTLGSNVPRTPSATSYGTVNDDGVNASSRQPLTSGTKVIKQTFKSRAGRFFLVVSTVVFAAAGVLGLISVAGSFAFFESLLPMAFWVPLVSCILLIFLSLVNFLAGCWKVTGASIASFVLSILVLGLGVGGLTVAAMISQGKLTDVIGEKWNATDAGHLSAICSFETFFECNGWKTPCPVINVTDAPTTDAPAQNFTTPPSSSSTPAPASDESTTPAPDKHETTTPVPGWLSTAAPTSSASGSGETTPAPHERRTTPAPDRRETTRAPKHEPTPSPGGGSSSIGHFVGQVDTPDRHDTPSPDGSGSNPPPPPPPPPPGGSGSGSQPSPKPTEHHHTDTAAPHHGDETTTPAPHNTTTESPHPPPPPPGAPAVYVCPDCPAAEVYSTLCDAALASNVKKHMPVIVACLLGVSLLSVANIVAVIMSHFAVLEIRRVD